MKMSRELLRYGAGVWLTHSWLGERNLFALRGAAGKCEAGMDHSHLATTGKPPGKVNTRKWAQKLLCDVSRKAVNKSLFPRHQAPAK